MEQKKNLILLHGPAISASRAHLLRVRANFSIDDVLVLEKDVTFGELTSALVNASLFSRERLVVVENPGDDFALTSIPDDITLVVWLDHEVSETKPIVKSIRALKGQVINYPESKEASIFPLLDLLTAHSNQAYAELVRIKQAGFGLQYIIVMILYLLRKELKAQRRHFNREQIIYFYKQVLEVDFKLKSGLLDEDQAQFELVGMFMKT